MYLSTCQVDFILQRMSSCFGNNGRTRAIHCGDFLRGKTQELLRCWPKIHYMRESTKKRRIIGQHLGKAHNVSLKHIICSFTAGAIRYILNTAYGRSSVMLDKRVLLLSYTTSFAFGRHVWSHPVL